MEPHDIDLKQSIDSSFYCSVCGEEVVLSLPSGKWRHSTEAAEDVTEEEKSMARVLAIPVDRVRAMRDAHLLDMALSRINLPRKVTLQNLGSASHRVYQVLVNLKTDEAFYLSEFVNRKPKPEEKYNPYQVAFDYFMVSAEPYMEQGRGDMKMVREIWEDSKNLLRTSEVAKEPEDKRPIATKVVAEAYYRAYQNLESTVRNFLLNDGSVDSGSHKEDLRNRADEISRGLKEDLE